MARLNHRRAPSTSSTSLRRKPRRFNPCCELLEDRLVLDSRWLAQFDGFPGMTRAEQLVHAQQLFADADLQDQGIGIIDHVGYDGVLLLSAPDGTIETDLESELGIVPGYFEADVFDPFATNTSEIAVSVGPLMRRPPPSGPSGPDDDGGPGPTPPTSGSGFDGIIAVQGGNFRPPDITGAAGPSSYVQAVNNAVAIYSKAGAVIAGPLSSFTFFTSVRIAGGTVFDPVVVYNEHTDRFAVGFADTDFGAQSRFVMAISN
jgi:hypothetical protein